MNKKTFLILLTLSTSISPNSLKIQSLTELLPAHPEIQYIKCHDAQPFEYKPFPISKFPQLHPNEGLFQELFVLKIPNGQVFFNRGYIKINDSIIEECIPQYLSMAFHTTVIQNFPTDAKPVHIQGKVAVLTMLLDPYYSHWMYNVLSRLALLEMNNIEYDWLYVAYDMPFMKETLSLWGIDSSKIIQPFGNTRYIQADQLIVPSHPGTRIPLPHQHPLNWIPIEQYCKIWQTCPEKMLLKGHDAHSTVNTPLPLNISIHDCFLSLAPLCSIYFDPITLTYIKNKFLSIIKNKSYHFPKKIFISRCDTSVRKMLNEDQVFALFEQHGFKRYLLSHMSILEQVALFHGAEIIIAAHGTALINLMFCKPGTKVIEIFQGRSDCSLYFLSQTLQLEHSCIKTMDFEDIEGGQNTIVPLNIIEHIINTIIE